MSERSDFLEKCVWCYHEKGIFLIKKDYLEIPYINAYTSGKYCYTLDWRHVYIYSKHELRSSSVLEELLKVEKDRWYRACYLGER